MVLSWLRHPKTDDLEISDDIAIKVDGVSKFFKKKNKKIVALNDVSFEVKKGEFFAIVGRSGSGKTTLLNLLGLMDRPHSGRIGINGKTINNLSDRELTQIRKKEIATVYQNYNLIPVLTAFQNVELPLILNDMPKDERKQRVEKLLDIVGLLDRLDHKPDELSGGEKQRVTIARALANKPGIMLMDEPTGDLDREIGDEIIELIEGINRDLKTTIILITHDKELAKRADRIMEMRTGDLLGIEEGMGANIRESENKTRVAKDESYY